MIKKYKKKPVVIDAVEFEYTKECIAYLQTWLGSSFKRTGKPRTPDAKGWLEIGTLEDGEDDFQVKHIATEGDFIIKGVQGEFYPCKPDIFKNTYQEVINPIVDNRDSDIGC